MTKLWYYMHTEHQMMEVFQMTTLTISRLLRLNHTSDYGTINVLREFQTFGGLCKNNRRPKIDIGVEIPDDGLPKDYRLQVFKVSSRRLDSIVSRAVGQGRGQAEKLILTGKVQINEEDIPKKAAYYVQQNDIIDIWKQPVEGNTKFAESDHYGF
uniref:Bm2809, isoform b n=1 Tax=Brugia malayi TaxID=6279 RepID=A0A1I9G2N5_BRUMA|nr:Bm2809, isoform b [Brugia malayi]